MRRPTAGASSTSAARTSGCSTRRSDSDARGRDPACPRTARRRRASSSPPASTWHRSAASGRPQRWRWSRAASCSASRSGKARSRQLRRARRRAHRPRPVARRRQHPGRRQRRLGRGAASQVVEARGHAYLRLGHRPRRRAARRAARQRGRLRQPSQRGLDRRSSTAASCTPSIAASAGASTISPGRPTAPGSPTPSRPAPRHTRDQAARRRGAQQHARAPSPSSATTRPSFDPDGKYLYFLSLRTFDPVYDSVQFELSFPRAARPYLIALQAGGAAAVRAGTRRA